MEDDAQQLTIDGQAVPVVTVGGRECAAAAHGPHAAPRLFEPAPEQIVGQSSLSLDVAGCTGCEQTGGQSS